MWFSIQPITFQNLNFCLFVRKLARGSVGKSVGIGSVSCEPVQSYALSYLLILSHSFLHLFRLYERQGSTVVKCLLLICGVADSNTDEVKCILSLLNT